MELSAEIKQLSQELGVPQNQLIIRAVELFKATLATGVVLAGK